MHFRAQCWKRLVGERLARFAPDHGGTDAPVDDEGRAQRRPKDLRLADQRHHLGAGPQVVGAGLHRSEEHTSELQSLMRISYAVFCLKKNNKLTYTRTSTNY